MHATDNVMLYRNFATQEQLDAQYLTASQLADPAAFMRQRQADSDEARRFLPHLLDVAYGPTRIERMDIYPAERSGAPMVMFIHGGYWSTPSITKDFYAWVARGLQPRGITTLVLDYASCPQVTLDEIVRQCRAAVAWTHKHAHSFGGDPARIYAAGHSAGGHLSAVLGLTHWELDYELPPDAVKGAFAISGLFDLTPFPYTWLQPKLQLSWAEVRRHSPIALVREGGAPMVLAYGELETAEFHRQAADFQAACASVSIPASLLSLEGCLHNTAIDGFSDSQSVLCRALLKLMGLPTPT
jgi:arylformamidase